MFCFGVQLASATKEGDIVVKSELKPQMRRGIRAQEVRSPRVGDARDTLVP